MHSTLKGGIYDRQTAPAYSYEKEGFRIVAMKMVNADEETLKKHYPDSMAAAVGQKSANAGEEEAKQDPTAFGIKVLGWLRWPLKKAPTT